MKWWIHDLPKGIRVPRYQNKHTEKVTPQSKLSHSPVTLISYNVNEEANLSTSSCWQFKAIARAVAGATKRIIMTIIIIMMMIIVMDERWQLVNVKSIAVANTDEGWVMTAAPVSCKTHFTQNSTIWHGGMSSTEPSGIASTTVTHRNTSIRHLSSSLSAKTVPAKQFGFTTIIKNTMVVCHSSAGLV